MTFAVLAFALLLAAANGSNDDPKGIATLGGAGVTRYWHALAWGVATTLTGSLLSTQLAARLTKLFSSGIVTAHPSSAFALAVLVGATAWVILAPAARLPVSTTHALVWALVGAGLVLGPDSVAWSGLTPKVIEPLLVSIVIAYAASVALNLLPSRVPECLCIGVGRRRASAATATPVTLALATPEPAAIVHTGTVAECQLHRANGPAIWFSVNGLHWLSAGAASFGRGLNDTPKIVAIAAFTPAPAGMSAAQIAALVAMAMAAGGLVGGLRVARRLGNDVVAMDHLEGAKANFVSAALVGLGATQGLPISLTHVSTGAIAGSAGAHPSRLNLRTLRDFAIAWTVTPLIAGAVAAATFLLIR